MVAGLLHPLAIYVLALGSGFLIPLLFRARAGFAVALFMLALAGMTLIPTLGFVALLQGAATIEILTAGVVPPFAINLRFGLAESLFVLAVNLAGLLAAWHYLHRLRETAAAMLLCIILIMGIDGMIMHCAGHLWPGWSGGFGQRARRRFQVHHRHLDCLGPAAARDHLRVPPDRHPEHR